MAVKLFVGGLSFSTSVTITQPSGLNCSKASRLGASDIAVG